MAIGDVFELVVNQLIEDTPILNRFYYEQLDANGSASRLANAFVDVILPSWVPRVSDSLSFTTVKATNLMSPGAQSEVLANVTGSLVGATLPRFTNAVISLIPDNKLVRTGRKALTGIRELDTNGSFLSTEQQGEYQDLGDVFASDLTHLVSGAVFGARLFSPPNLSHPAATIVSSFTSLAKDRLSTQSTRKT